MKRDLMLAAVGAVALSILVPARCLAGETALFNGVDLTGWTVGGSVEWTVEDGVLKNLAPADHLNWIRSDFVLPGSDFYIDIRFRVREGMRTRMHVLFDELYFGNEGFEHQIEIYGNSVHNARQVRDDGYALDEWMDVRLAVSAEGEVRLYRDGLVTHLAQTWPIVQTQFTVLPGDGWSPGLIEIERLVYGQPYCPADMNLDGTLNVFDFLAFQTFFGEEAVEADLAPPEGIYNIFDFLAFQTAFSGGC